MLMFPNIVSVGADEVVFAYDEHTGIYMDWNPYTGELTQSSWGGSSLVATPRLYGYELVNRIYASYDGYSWTAFYTFQRLSDGAIMVGRSGGCSCNTPADDITVETLVEYHTFIDYIRNLGKWAANAFSRLCYENYPPSIDQLNTDVRKAQEAARKAFGRR